MVIHSAFLSLVSSGVPVRHFSAIVVFLLLLFNVVSCSFPLTLLPVFVSTIDCQYLKERSDCALFKIASVSA